jgi:hypothetical protein
LAFFGIVASTVSNIPRADDTVPTRTRRRDEISALTGTLPYAWESGQPSWNRDMKLNLRTLEKNGNTPNPMARVVQKRYMRAGSGKNPLQTNLYA